MAIIEQIDERKNYIQYRINDEYVLCKPKAQESLEEEIREIHERSERITREAVQATGREKG